MARTSPEQVKGILVGNYNGTTDLGPFIDTAASLVRKIRSADSDRSLSSEDLKLIEAYLAAHFYGHSDQFYSSKSTAGASGNYQGQTAMIFNASLYGQTALALDTTGTLANIQQTAMNGRKTATVEWLGTRYDGDYSRRSEDQ